MEKQNKQTWKRIGPNYRTEEEATRAKEDWQAQGNVAAVDQEVLLIGGCACKRWFVVVKVVVRSIKIL